MRLWANVLDTYGLIVCSGAVLLLAVRVWRIENAIKKMAGGKYAPLLRWW